MVFLGSKFLKDVCFEYGKVRLVNINEILEYC